MATRAASSSAKLFPAQRQRVARDAQEGSMVAVFLATSRTDRWDPPKGSKLEVKWDPLFQGNLGW